MRTFLFCILCLLIAAAIVLTFNVNPIPFFTGPLLISIPFWILAFNKRKRKVLWFNAASILIVLAFFELGFILLEVRGNNFIYQSSLERVYEPEMDSILGWKLKENTTRISRKSINNKLIYEAKVSVDSNGLRVTPPCIAPCNESILFFGDSYTYGEGVNDEETLPWQFSEMSGNRYRVFNFGVHGYGPHQMLALLEHGIAKSKVSDRVVHVFCQLKYPDHVYRLCGYAIWEIGSPKYVLDHEKQAVSAGNFDDNLSRYRFRKGALSKSAFFRKLFSYQKSLLQEEKELLLAILRKSHSLLMEQFPGMQFHVIVWGRPGESDSFIFDQLEQDGIELHYANSIFPGGTVSNDYKISLRDEHPNAKSNALLAGYFCDRVLNDSLPE